MSRGPGRCSAISRRRRRYGEIWWFSREKKDPPFPLGIFSAIFRYVGGPPGLHDNGLARPSGAAAAAINLTCASHTNAAHDLLEIESAYQQPHESAARYSVATSRHRPDGRGPAVVTRARLVASASTNASEEIFLAYARQRGCRRAPLPRAFLSARSRDILSRRSLYKARNVHLAEE